LIHAEKWGTRREKRGGRRAVLGIGREMTINHEKVLYKDKTNNSHGEFSCHGLEKEASRYALL